MKHFPSGRFRLSRICSRMLADHSLSKNCTKHQVRCDYMEKAGLDMDDPQGSDRPTVAFTPRTESQIDSWQQTGSFPYPNLNILPPPRAHDYNDVDLRLIHHLSSTSNQLLMMGITNMTTWTQKMPQ